MRQRRVEALRRCAVRAEIFGFPSACTVNPFAAKQSATVLPAIPIPDGLTIATVLHVAAIVTGVSVAELKGWNRSPRVSIPRQFAYWLLRRRLAMTDGAIGRYCKKDKTGVREGIRRTDERLGDDWPMIIAWRGRAAELLNRYDMSVDGQPEHTAI